jgi:signal transduction histidine kinase
MLLEPTGSAARRAAPRRRRRAPQTAAQEAVLIATRGAMLETIGRILRSATTGSGDSGASALAAAEQAATRLLGSARPELCAEHFVASALASLATETSFDVAALKPTIKRLEAEFDLDPLEIGLLALGDPVLLRLALEPAITAVMGLLRAVAPMQKVSLRLCEPEQEPSCQQPGWQATAEEPQTQAGAADLIGIAMIQCWHRPYGALVFLPESGRQGTCDALAERSAALLGPVFERASLIEGHMARFDALISTRLAYDLHDGPLQDVAVLVGDLEGLRRRLDETIGGTPLGEELVAQAEDAAAVAQFLIGDLRDLASSIDGSGLGRKRLHEIVEGLVRKFSTRAEAEVALEIQGDTDSLTDSQKITLIRVMQEALSNVREHSAAANVELRIDARGPQVHATLRDDGCGFDVDEALRRAGRGGRMGLAGMFERVRLLGGVCDITSRPGEGTEISLTIARSVPKPETLTPQAPPVANAS